MMDLENELFFAPIDLPSEESDDEEGDQKIEAFSQIVTFIVDASCLLKDEHTYNTIRSVLLHKVLDLGLQSKNNKVGLVFYGTENSSGHGENDQGRPETTWFLPVAPPQMHKVQEFASTTLDEMRDVCGGATERATATEALRNVCEEVLMIVNHAKGKTKALPTFVFVSAEPSPLSQGLKADELAAWDTKARRLRRAGFVLVAPASSAKGMFSDDAASLWCKLDRLQGRGRNLSDSCLATMHRDLSTLWPVVKGLRPQRFFFKLSDRMVLPMLGVKLVQSTDARAATKSVDCTTQKEIVSAKTWRHPIDGTTVAPEDISHKALDLVNSSKFSGVPRALVVPNERAVELRGGVGFSGPLPCITLLKFVPSETLTLHHQISGARFLYVDTRLPMTAAADASDQQRAETALRAAHVKMFLSLHNAMADVSALVTVKQRLDIPPRLAMLAAIDDQDDRDGTQVQPPGFALHMLPYTDEVRLVSASCPALPPAVVPKLPRIPRASPFAVNAAGALVDALTDPHASRYQFDGPKQLYREATIRAQVLGDEPPDRKDRAFNGVRRFMEARAVPAGVREAFLGQVLGGQKTDPGAAAAAAGKKRAAPAMSDADIATHIDWKGEVAAGKIIKHTVDTLKGFLRHHQLPTAGKKAELVQRVEEKVRNM
eukprot:jgi/Ulvmu1/859/UM100_0010.1